MKGLLSANMKSHGSRYRATVIAVALAVAFILTAFGLAGALQYSAKASVASNVLGADGIISDVVYQNLDDSVQNPTDKIWEHLKNDPKVHGEPIYVGIEEVTVPGGADSGFLRIAQVRPEPFGNPKLAEGKLPAASDEVALPEFVKANLSVKVGSKVKMTGIDREFKISGFTEVENGINSAPSILYAAGQIPKLYEDRYVSEVVFNVEGKKGDAAVEYVRAEAHKILPDLDTEEIVLSSEEYVEKQMEDIAEGMPAVLAVVLVFPGIAAVTAIIVISTTFQVMLAQRKRELALLRAIGADARQIRGLMIKENLIVGLLASIAGLLLGAVSSTLLNKFTKIVPEWADAFLAIPLWGYASALAIGVLITLIAGIRPAFQAGNLSPMVALEPVDSAAVQKSKRLTRLIFGIVITGIGLACITIATVSPDFGKEAAQFGLAFLGGMVSFIGVLMLLTWLVPYITRGIGKLIGKNSVTFQMAGENTWRNPARTGATGTALVLGITLVTMMIVGAKSVETSVLTEIDEKRPIDLIVSTEDNRPLTDAEITAINKTENVTQVAITKAFRVPAGDAADPMGNGYMQINEAIDLSKVAHTDVATPPEGTVAVDGWLYDPDEGTKQFSAGDKSMTFAVQAAHTPNYTLSSKDFEAVRAMYGDEAVDSSVAFVRIKDGLSISQVLETRNNLMDKVQAPQVGGSALERAAMVLAIKSMLIATVVMLAVSVLVALVGVTNTLALSVVERRRENAMVRALGMTKGDLRRMITWETVLIAGVATVVGVAMGIGYGALGLHALPIGEATRHLVIPWDQVAVAALISFLAALLASIMPARLAAKASPVEALADVG